MEKQKTGQKHNKEHMQGREFMNKQAIALSYDPADEAPKVIATGKGYLAQKIIDKAVESDVPLHQDAKLAKTLSKLDIGDVIPPELYGIIAEILVFVDKMEKIRSKVDGKK